MTVGDELSITNKQSASKMPIVTAGIYVFVSTLWIYTSDSLVSNLFRDPHVFAAISMYKGFGFVAVTGALLFALLQRASKVLSVSNDRLYRLIESSPVCMAVISPEGTPQFVNKRFLEVFGYTLEDIPDLEAWWQRCYPDPDYRLHVQRDWTDQVALAASTNGDIPAREYCIRTKNGSDLTVEICGTTMPNAIVVCLQDVTDKKRAALALQASEERYRRIFEYAPVGIVQLTVGGEFITVNQSVAAMLGYQSTADMMRELNGGHHQLFLNEQRRANLLERVMATDGFIQFEELFRRSDMSLLTASVTVRAVRSPDGSIRFVEGFIEDYTDKRKAEIAIAAEEAKMRAFLRDVLKSVTDGHLNLAFNAAELPAKMPLAAEPHFATAPSLRYVRELIANAALVVGHDDIRRYDLLTGAGEAVMNAVVHAGGGMVTICRDEQRRVVQVWIEDTGKGIARDTIHRATLERGFTTAGTLGHGFSMMLNTVDRVYLLTGPAGTTIVLEQEAVAPELLFPAFGTAATMVIPSSG
ncbi:MAG TPA: PAS domain S-box protein [Capsulimonadaceae bacterium]